MAQMLSTSRQKQTVNIHHSHSDGTKTLRAIHWVIRHKTANMLSCVLSRVRTIVTCFG